MELYSVNLDFPRKKGERKTRRRRFVVLAESPEAAAAHVSREWGVLGGEITSTTAYDDVVVDLGCVFV